MADWILVPCLVSLRTEFDTLAPHRDRTSDGSIGNPAHARSSSDHNPDETGNTPSEDADRVNEVHAIDVDDDLRKPGWTMARAVQVIVGRHRAGKDDRLQNVIFDRQVWSRSWGWAARDYAGPSPHTEHAHFSARYTTAQERDTRPWGLLEDDMTEAEVMAAVLKALESDRGQKAVGAGSWNHVEINPATGKKDFRMGGWARNDLVRSAERMDVLTSGLDEILAVLAQRPAPEIAEVLRRSLGDRAGEVGRLLQ
ncbi:hypothetical protein [Actinoplanes awajinensis]|uniref:Uncharacterized protein n=1 Tax=Actinoplanes awajinensis subsp. mycoplanecinus TaxID=135947 RepID=A0A101JLY1_9ACTN|nr:hypothetical protein [Actinoplanes awajinensis]KUL29221.1 hypothetical protein ADL15_29120 [Actinoplanes awajinensis subsp. mycoplanecinus]